MKKFILTTLILLFSVGSSIGADNESFDEWVSKQEGKPIDPMTSYSYSEEATWTTWNKFWFASAIGANVADVMSTQDALDRGCEEANPIYGSNPSVAVMVLIKAALIGGTYYFIETADGTVEERQMARNVAYGMHTFLVGGVALHNYRVNCY